MCRNIIAIVLTIIVVFVLWKYLFSNLLPDSVNQNRSTTPNLSNCGALRADQYFNLQKAVEPNEFPWMAVVARVVQKIPYHHSVLINEQYLLAAAYFFHNDQDAKSYMVEFGFCGYRKPCITGMELETIVLHPKYIVREPSYDISLLRLKKPVRRAAFMQPICLPGAENSDVNFIGKYLTLTGRQVFGGLNAKLPVLVVDFVRCQKSYDAHLLDNSVICGSTCDNGSMYVSGSVLMAVSMRNALPEKYYLVGILTFGKENCSDSSPNIFQRIDSHMDWIKDNIVKLDQADQVDPK